MEDKKKPVQKWSGQGAKTHGKDTSKARQKQITFYLPEKLVNTLVSYNNNNPPGFKYETEIVWYILLEIVEKQVVNRDQEFVPLNLKKLTSIINCNPDKYIKYLRNGEIIQCDLIYVPGQKSYEYKINPDFLDRCISVTIRSSILLENILKQQRQKKAHMNRLPLHLQAMYREFMETELDYKTARKWVNSQSPDKQVFYITSLNAFKDHRFRYFHRNTTNDRLDTNLTNMKKELRCCLRGDYVEIDLKNSQPFFLSVFLKKIGEQEGDTQGGSSSPLSLMFSNLIKKSMQTFGLQTVKKVQKCHQKGDFSKMVKLSKFHEYVMKGTLYEAFSKKYGITRDEAKDILLKVLYSRNLGYKNYKSFIPYEQEKRKFAEMFPFVAEIIVILKEKDHSKLAIVLQKLESYAVIDCICSRLVNAGIVPLTVHDSVIVPCTKQETTIKIMEQFFRDCFGETPVLRVKYLN